jgi:hypothetical protein
LKKVGKQQEFGKIEKARAFIDKIVFSSGFSILFFTVGILQIFVYSTIIIYGFYT